MAVTVVSKRARTPIDAVQQVAEAADSELLDGKDSTEFSEHDHDHDAAYSAIDHDHDAAYSAIDHDHDADYSAIDHNHDTVYCRWRGSSASEPATPIAGDIWIDTDDSKVYFYNGATWVALS